MAQLGIGKWKKIKVIDVTPTKDGDGHQVANETVLFSGWAEVFSPGGGRNYVNGKDSFDFNTSFRIRSNNVSISVNNRIIYWGKTYTVNSVEREKEKKFYLILRATAQDHV